MQYQVHSSGCRRDRNGMFAADLLNELVFELPDLGTRRNPSGLQDRHDLIDIARINIRAGKRQKLEPGRIGERSSSLYRTQATG